MEPTEYPELARLAVALSAKASTSPWLFTGEDALRVRVFNSVTSCRLVLEGRVLRFDGIAHPFAAEFTPNSDRTESTHLVTVGDGFLLNFSIRASSASPRVGQCFATVEMVRGRLGAVQILGALAAGYVTDTQRFAWPGSPVRTSTDGRGVMRSITGTDPAAGAEASETVPTNARWLLLAFTLRLVTDATVANRHVRLVIDDGATTFFSSDSEAAQAASDNWAYNAGIGMDRRAGVSDNRMWALPAGLMLPGGARIRTSTSNIAAGDNFSAPQLLVEEWIED